MQLAKKQFTDHKALMAGARAFVEEKRGLILKGFNERKEDIFRPVSGKPVTITPENIVQLCEISGAGVNILGYIHGTAHARKKYLQFQDLFLVIKRVNEPLKDPYWILKEGPPPNEKKINRRSCRN